MSSISGRLTVVEVRMEIAKLLGLMLARYVIILLQNITKVLDLFGKLIT